MMRILNNDWRTEFKGIMEVKDKMPYKCWVTELANGDYRN